MRVLAGVLVAAILAAIGFYLFNSSSDPGAPANAAASADETPRPISAPAIEDGPARRAESAKAEAQRAPGVPPESYAQSLGAIVGRVLDTDRRPVEDMEVELLGGNVFELLPAQDAFFDSPSLPDVKLVAAAAKTDAEGRFRFDGLDPHGFFVFRLDKDGPRSTYRLTSGSPAPGQVLDVGDLVLDPYATLVGRVLDEDGAPVAGALLLASVIPVEAFKYGLADLGKEAAVAFQEPPAKEWQLLEVPPVVMRLVDLIPFNRASTGEDGRFRIEGVPLGMISLVARGHDLLPLVRGPIATTGGGEKDVGDLRLLEGDALEGSVVVMDGDKEVPVEGAEVRIGAQLPFFPVAALLRKTTTGADGRFRFDGVADDAQVVAVRGKDRAGFEIVAGVRAGIDEPKIVLGATATLSVVVLDPQQQRVQGARILVQEKTPLSESKLLQPPLNLAGRSEALPDGSTRITGLARTRYDVSVRKDGFAVAAGTADCSSGEGRIELALKPELTGSVQVVSKQTHEPIEHAMVMAFDSAKSIELIPLTARRTDADGLAFLKALPEGKVGLQVFHPRFAITSAELKVPGEPIVVEMKAGGTLRGRVLKDGQPLAEPYTVVAWSDADGELVLPRLTLSNPADSTFEMNRLQPATYTLTAVKNLSELSSSTAGDAAGAGVFGIHTNASTRREDGAGGGSDGVHIEIGSGPPPRASGSAGAGGTEGASKPVAPPPPESRYQAVVREGETAYVDVDVARMPGDFPKARLRGRVLLNGAAGEGLSVTATPASGVNARSGRCDERGAFDLGEVPAGDLEVAVSMNEAGLTGELALRKLTLKEGEQGDVSIDVDTGELAGTVRSARDGSPLADARLVLLPSGGGGEYGALTAASGNDGRFRFEVVPGGEYALMVEHTGFARATTSAFRVPARGHGPDQDVRLLAAVPASGTLELPAEAGPVPFSVIHFRHPGVEEMGAFALVDPATREWKVDAIGPGDYEVDVYGAEKEFEKLKVAVPADGLAEYVLRPHLK